MNSQSQSTMTFRNYRWVICALLFFSTTFNYMDRQVISYLKNYIFCVPMETTADFSTISEKDLYLPTFAGKINRSTDAVSAFIRTNLPASTLLALKNYSGGSSFSQTSNLVFLRRDFADGNTNITRSKPIRRRARPLEQIVTG
jgi:hypothetical protein